MAAGFGVLGAKTARYIEPNNAYLKSPNSNPLERVDAQQIDRNFVSCWERITVFNYSGASGTSISAPGAIGTNMNTNDLGIGYNLAGRYWHLKFTVSGFFRGNGPTNMGFRWRYLTNNGNQAGNSGQMRFFQRYGSSGNTLYTYNSVGSGTTAIPLFEYFGNNTNLSTSFAPGKGEPFYLEADSSVYGYYIGAHHSTLKVSFTNNNGVPMGHSAHYYAATGTGYTQFRVSGASLYAPYQNNNMTFNGTAALWGLRDTGITYTNNSGLNSNAGNYAAGLGLPREATWGNYPSDNRTYTLPFTNDGTIEP